MAAAAILDFQNFKLLTAGTVKGVELHQCAKFRENRSKRGRNMTISQDGGRRHLGFSKFQNFNGRHVQEGGIASACQILSKSVEARPRYCTRTAPACQIS